MKYFCIFTIACSLLVFAYTSAQQKMTSTLDIQSLHLGMSKDALENSFGTPSAQNRNQLTYIFEDYSELIITMRDDKVSSAQLKYHRPLKIEDPKLQELTLVQMESDTLSSNLPSWFFAGKPEEGLIYKITADGVVESLTWIPPFTYGDNKPKNLHALLKDFQSQNLSQM